MCNICCLFVTFQASRTYICGIIHSDEFVQYSLEERKDLVDQEQDETQDNTSAHIFHSRWWVNSREFTFQMSHRKDENSAEKWYIGCH